MLGKSNVIRSPNGEKGCITRTTGAGAGALQASAKTLEFDRLGMGEGFSSRLPSLLLLLLLEACVGAAESDGSCPCGICFLRRVQHTPQS
jgi:hypothetical protein